jgi:serine/threonine-protein kinase
MGRCQLDSLHCLYVVMEYAEQNLAHFLAQRALTDLEVREMMPATLDALAFLHSRNLVHGQLKPSNILVVGDQLKLASDTIRPAGEAATSISMVSVYDPPEGRDGSFSTAGDIWALGITLYEALTLTTPSKPDERSHGVVLPPDFPPGCAKIVRECLSRRAVDRPTVAGLQSWVSRGLQEAATPVSASRGDAPGVPDRPGVSSVGAGGAVRPAATRDTATAPARGAGAAGIASATTEHPALSAASVIPDPGGRLTIRAVVEREPPLQEEPRRSFVPFALAAIAALAVAWVGMRLLGGRAPSSEPPAVPSQSAPQQAEPATAPEPNTKSGTASPGAKSAETLPPARNNITSPVSAAVVHEEMPHASRGALATIHGHVRVAVRVTVDAAGNVVNDTLADPGPSRYFARVASQAARQWKFSPAPGKASRQWLVHFEFSRTGTAAHAVEKF